MEMQDCKVRLVLRPKIQTLLLILSMLTHRLLETINWQSGLLIYVMTQTRPDLAYSVSTLSKSSAHPSKEHAQIRGSLRPLRPPPRSPPGGSP